MGEVTPMDVLDPQILAGQPPGFMVPRMIAYIGIDPGIKGAAVLIEKGGRFQMADWTDEHEARNLVHMWAGRYSPCHVAIEKVFNIQVQYHQKGAGRYFGNIKLAINYGFWLGLWSSHGIDCTEVAPRSWQSKMLLKGSGKNMKERAFNTVREVFPQTRDMIKFKTKHNGRADAFLIAWWMMSQYENNGFLKMRGD